MSSSTTASSQPLEGYELSPQQARRFRWQARRLCLRARTAQLCLRLPEDSDLTRLRASLGRVLERHEILRTSYQRLPGMALPLQVIAPVPALRWSAFESQAGDPQEDSLTVAVTRADSGLKLRLWLPATHLDAASLLLFAEAWCAAYRGEDSEHRPLQYADYAAWRSELARSEPGAEEYWGRERASRAPAVQLPLRGRVRASERPIEHAQLVLSLSRELAERWRAAAEARKLEPALLALAAWITLVHQHSEADQLTLALDWQTRAPQLGDALGLFGEPLPLTVRSLGSSSVDQLSSALAARVNELRERRDSFPSDLDEELSAIGFRYVPARERSLLSAAGWRIESLESPQAPHHLSLEVRSGPDEPMLGLHYDRAFYDRAGAELLGDQLLALLANVCREPARRLTELSALSAAERELVSEVLSRSDPLSPEREREYARIAALPHLFACFAEPLRRRAQQPAVRAAGRTVSYAELDAQSAKLGQRLLARGARSGARVAHFLPRDADAIAGMLGILRAGAVYVPIDPDYPSERIAYLLADCGADFILTREELVGRLPGSAHDPSKLLFVEAQPNEADAPPGTPGRFRPRALESAPALPWPELRPEQVAYIIYTSGSTGQPRGVPISHANALYSLAARVAYYPDPIQHFLLLSSFAFDSSIAGLFGTLAQGGCLHVCSEREQKDPARLAAIVCEQGISHLLALPSLLQLALTKLAGRPNALIAAIVAGESCPYELLEEHRRTLPRTRLYNEYGATEASVWSTVGECVGAESPGATAAGELSSTGKGSPTAAGHDAPPERPVSIGRPIPHSRVYVLDPQREPVARGLKGEIYVGGPGLSAGYLHRPELTEEKFVELRGERLYRTGDFAYWDERGELVFLGRADGQVKIRGYRIELGEVEAALRRVTGAEQIAVLSERGEDGEVSLRGFVESERTLDLVQTHEALAQLLPAPMIPADIQALPTFPCGPNGKLDRRALLSRKKRTQRAPYEEPRSPAEARLAKLWEDLLKSDPVGRDDDFFALGGHSLLAVRLVHQIQVTFGAEIPVSKVFEHAKLAALAAQLEAPLPEGAPAFAGLVRLDGEGRGAPLFCVDPTGLHLDAYRALAGALAAERAIWGLELGPALEAEGASIARISDRLARTLRQQQPEGPYRLLGWSLAGAIALGIARALEQQGERVALLCILDSQPPVRLYARGQPDVVDELAAYVDLDRRSALWALPPSELAALRERLSGLSAEARLIEAVGWAQAYGLLRDQAAPEAFAHRYALLRDAALYLNALPPGALSAPIHVWWSSQTVSRHGAPPVDWQTYTRGAVDVSVVSGDHHAPLHAAEVQLRLRALLEEP